VKDEMSRLFAKYDQKFGATRSEWPPMPHASPGKRKQAWGKIYDGPGASSTCSPSPFSPSGSGGVNELSAYLDNDPIKDWGSPLIYYCGGVTIS
jgi:hypothetical protein